MKNKTTLSPKRKSFLNRLTEKLHNLKDVEINQDSFNDKSASWVEIKSKDMTISIEFDFKGEKIERIGVFKDIIQVVDQQNILIIQNK